MLSNLLLSPGILLLKRGNPERLEKRLAEGELKHDDGRAQATELVERARGGDHGAYEALYRAHSGRVYAICLRMVADPGRAKDLTQDVFVRAWQKLGDLEAPAAFPSWLARLATNEALMWLRRLKRRSAIEVPGQLASVEPLYVSSQAESPGARVDLERAIARLPDQARVVFVLHDVEGYRHGEIARLMDIAVGTSKAQLHRARSLLREVLKK